MSYRCRQKQSFVYISFITLPQVTVGSAFIYLKVHNITQNSIFCVYRKIDIIFFIKFFTAFYYENKQ
jgi:hypothetical protein